MLVLFHMMPVSLPFALLLALAPAALCWWSGRKLAGRLDDPALPELMLAEQQKLMKIMAGGIVLLAFVGPDHWFWLAPLLLIALYVSRYPLRRSMYGERLSVLSYLRYGVFAFIGGVGPMFATALLPTFVLSIVANTRVGEDSRGSVGLAAMLGSLLGAGILLWQWYYPRFWLDLHRATPLAQRASASLLARLEGVLDRAGNLLHKRPTIHRYGAPGAYVMNAVAIPSSHSPAVAFGETLLATLTEDEIVAVFAHEIAHHEQYNRKRLRRGWWAAVALVTLSAALPAVLLLAVPGIGGIVAGAVPIGIALALGGRAARSRSDETASDRRAVALTGDPAALASALRKLHVYSRVPRRWPHDFERIATHPSLAHRLQAIAEQGAVPAAPLAGPTIVRSARRGLVVVLEEARAHWFEGVPDDTPHDLAALRDRASSYRAFAYGDLTDLRVAVAGQERVLQAADRDGRKWVVVLRPEDVETVQTALDVVDVRLGAPRAPAGQVRPGLARALAASLLIAIMIASGLGVLVLPATVLALRPSTAALVATGAMAVAQAAVTLATAGDATRFAMWGAGVALVAGALLLFFGVRGARGRKDDATSDDSSWRDAKPLLITMTVVVILLALAVLPALVSAPSATAEHPLAMPLAMMLLGLGASLTTLRAGRWRATGSGTTACAAVAIVALASNGWLYGRMPEFAWSDRAASVVASTTAEPRSLQVALSPSGTRILIRQAAASIHDEAETSRFVVGSVTADSIVMREPLYGLAAFLLDDSSLLVLDSAGKDSLALRLLRLPGVDGRRTLDTLWQRKTPAMTYPQLFVDRTRQRWRAVGRVAGEELVIAMGSFASDSIVVKRVALDESLGQVLTVFGNGTALVPEFIRPTQESAMGTWLAMMGSFSLRWNLFRIGAERQAVGTSTGFPSCGSSLTDDLALCSEISGPRPSRVWRVGGSGRMVHVGMLPASYDIAHTEDGTRLIGLSRMTPRAALVNAESRSGTRIRIPEDGLSPSRRWSLDASWSGDRLAVLSAGGRGGTRITIYRLK